MAAEDVFVLVLTSVTLTPFRAAPVWSVIAPEMVPLPCCACPAWTKQISPSDNRDHKVFDRNMVKPLLRPEKARIGFSLPQETSDVKSKVSDGRWDRRFRLSF